jgi:release factor glutamine methyltransferase
MSGESPDPSVRARSAAAEAVLKEAGVEGARREAALLAAWSMEIPLARYYALLAEPFPEDRLPQFLDAVRRRALREPFAYITGSFGFHGHSFAVGPGVLVPRPETELLVETALEAGLALPSGSVDFLDLCTGSGCIAISLALAFQEKGRTPHAAATDVSETALRTARENARRLAPGLDLVFLLADLLPPEGRRFDLLVSNPPYVPSDEIAPLAPEITRYEPREALDGGPDGLAFLRRIVVAATRFLKTGGWLFLEHGSDQAEAVRALLVDDPLFERVETRQDLSGHPRVTLARFAAAADLMDSL